MLVDLEPKSLDTISSGPVLQQTPYWGHVKSIQGWKARAFDIEFAVPKEQEPTKEFPRTLQDDLLLVTHPIGDGAEIAYVPYGPKVLPDEEQRGNILEELSENLKSFLPKSCILIRYDLPWESPWAGERDCFDEKGKWLGPPDIRVREFRMNYGTSQWNLRKAPTDMLPSSTLFVDLRISQEELLRKMKTKTRYNIHLAKRKGVAVYEAGPEFLETWYALYKETAQRNHITLHSIDFFKSLLEAKKRCVSGSAAVRLLIAEINGKPLAGMFLVLSGQRATYLYGASSNDCRNYMGTYALQWEAICQAKEAGCTHYDMFGVSQLPDPAHPMYGLYRFKSGFGGQFYHRQGCWDYPLNNGLYTGFRASELSATGYHLQ